jgi:hypothetical protein
MKPIKILYWTPLTFDNTKFTPVFFFKPSLELLTFIEQHGFFNIPITISGTNNLYDGFTYVLMDIATMPGGCPNDFQKTPVIYSCTMSDTAWTVYPYEPFIGEFTICSTLTDAEFKQPVLGAKVSPEEIKENFCGCFANKKKKDLEEDFAPPLETKSKVPQDNQPISNIVTFQEPPKEPVQKPKKYIAPNNTVIIICLFLAIIIVLILCFYGDLRNF